MQPSIRDARPADAERIAEIYAHYVRDTAVSFEYSPPSPAELAARMAETQRRYPYLVAEQSGRVQGYAYAGPFSGRAAYDWACEVSIYLDLALRRQGLGRLLYEALQRRLLEMGIRSLYACIAYPAREDEYLTRDSERFHARLGFETVGHFHECGNKFGRWYDMIWMEKPIAPHAPNPQPVRWPERDEKSVFAADSHTGEYPNSPRAGRYGGAACNGIQQ